MRKLALPLFLLAGSLTSATLAWSQQRSIDMEVILEAPGDKDTFDEEEPIPLTIIVKNLSAEALVPGDTLFYTLPDESTKIVVLQETIEKDQSAILLNANMTIPIDSTTTFGICSQVADDPTTQIKLDGQPIKMSYKDPDPSNNKFCVNITILKAKGSHIDQHSIAPGDFSLYPNPANRSFTIDSKNGASIQDIRLYNILGSEVLHIPGNQQSKQIIDIGSLSQAIYTLHIQTARGLSSKKLQILR